MKFRNFVVGTLILTCPVRSFAVCDEERAQRNHFRNLVNGASDASSVLGIGGLVIGVLIGGPIGIIGGLAGLLPGPSGANWRRILDEKERDLRNCEEAYRREQELAKERQKARRERIIEINGQFDERRGELREQFQRLINEMVAEFEAEGFDLNDNEIQNEIEEQRIALQGQHDHALAELEAERERAIAEI